MITIDLGEFTKGEVRNLSGHPRGSRARSHYEIEKLDKSSENILVKVPREVDTLGPSFFQGMFAESVISLGGPEKFFNHYFFDASPTVLIQLRRAASNALVNRDADYFNIDGR